MIFKKYLQKIFYKKLQVKKTRQITKELEKMYAHMCKPQGDINIDIYQHIPTLRKYASLCDHITEFGIRWVVSTWGLLAGKPKKLISYDINYHPNIEKIKSIAMKNDIDFIFQQINTLHTEIEETDLLFIDTLHTYNQLKNELTLHANKSKKYILLHDITSYAHRGMGPELGGDNIPKGLWDAIVEFLEANKHWKVHEIFQNNNGLVVLERSKK